ncbi:MAG: circadian clock protein KaiA [Okeania sp. SIO2D1]|nr:circadian clock protein KaiA [Okeania sp. SIO2D1]
MLPAVILFESRNFESCNPQTTAEAEVVPWEIVTYYHTGEVKLIANKIEQISQAIEQAIARFIDLASKKALGSQLAEEFLSSNSPDSKISLQQKQQRLAAKLRERLGYLGVYYKRNSEDFFGNLSSVQQQKLLEELHAEYTQIILNYFNENVSLNQAIDQFVNRAFFANLSISKILEMHMELMEKFAQQLKLEGRSEEILLDYRLTLIDIIAHLGEMYRRSIPREDINFEISSQID